MKSVYGICALALIACGADPAGRAVASAEKSGDPRPADATGEAPAEPIAAGLKDRGVFSDLDPKVTLRVASWLKPVDPKLLVDGPAGLSTLYLGGLPVKSYPLSGPVQAAAGGKDALVLEALPLRTEDRAELTRVAGEALVLAAVKKPAHVHGDSDRDGIPEPIDMLLGGHKTALNGDAYRETYEVIPYPGGDIGRDHGVCTDVIVRAARNAGLDLQKEVFQDMTASRSRYRLGTKEKADRNIDHRRVRRLLPWFSAYYRPLPIAFDPAASGREVWLPGDIVFLDTFPNKAGPDHIGIVSDRLGDDGLPLIINNWTDGYTTREMALLSFVPVTHRFRLGERSR